MKRSQRIGFILFKLLMVISMSAFGQFSKAIIGIDGMVCSACSYGVEMSIRKLKFVNDVVVDLNKNIATVSFKSNVQVSMDELAQKVYDAGFSVRSFDAAYNFKAPMFSKNCFTENNNYYQFIDTPDKTLKGSIMLKFVGDKFLAKKDLKKWKALIANTQTCKEAGFTKKYYITL